jgi:hypothetical protein
MHYIKGKEKVVVDALFHHRLANVISMVRNTMMQDIKKYYIQNQWFKEPYENLEK